MPSPAERSYTKTYSVPVTKEKKGGGAWKGLQGLLKRQKDSVHNNKAARESAKQQKKELVKREIDQKMNGRKKDEVKMCGDFIEGQEVCKKTKGREKLTFEKKELKTKKALLKKMEKDEEKLHRLRKQEMKKREKEIERERKRIRENEKKRLKEDEIRMAKLLEAEGAVFKRREQDEKKRNKQRAKETKEREKEIKKERKQLEKEKRTNTMKNNLAHKYDLHF